MHEARLYKTQDDGSVECMLCAHRCRITDGHKGICGVRENSGGVLNTLVYGSLIAEAVDPIEKKPFFHYLPGSASYSVSTVGCNFRCLHCQNFTISQMPKPKAENRITGTAATPVEIVRRVQSAGCSSIAYTYTEPTIFFEYAYDTAMLAHEQGIKNLFVTNGFMTPECVKEMTGLIDAANVDIKAFTEEFYKKVCGARLAPVLDSIENLRAAGVWVEVTT
ncbi:MAG: AmmeMemoRadiSam system radical SAM enzyme, partial [Proteobacteria bacterium]|nr:AmmeMemoRadiSam system radical SAM enzyme [Pseudomonadota bacterium]